jgi:CHRD domain
MANSKIIIFLPKSVFMKLIQSTAFFILFAAITFSTFSCNRDKDLFVRKEYTRVDIPLTGALNVPQSTSPGLGSMNIHYNTTTKILTYSMSWSGLTGAVTGAAIHGMAPAGFPAAILQSFTTSAITRCSRVSNTSCGRYSGRLFVDGVLVTEDNLLNGVYYVSIRTAANPTGEIRAQIKF